MPRFERSRERRGKRDSGREFSRFGRNRREVEMTEVTCSSCGVKCEVPFKPTSSKPVYCRDCFEKKGKVSFNKTFDRDHDDKPSDRDLDIINEKLNKIMKALKIE